MSTPPHGYVPFRLTHYGTGQRGVIFADPDDGVGGLLRVLASCGDLLAAMAGAAPPGLRGWHPYGSSDPEGLLAMGIAEVLLHSHDVLTGLDTGWRPDDQLCDRLLHRLFTRTAPADVDRWRVLLWLTGGGAAGTGSGRSRLALGLDRGSHLNPTLVPVFRSSKLPDMSAGRRSRRHSSDLGESAGGPTCVRRHRLW